MNIKINKMQHISIVRCRLCHSDDIRVYLVGRSMFALECDRCDEKVEIEVL